MRHFRHLYPRVTFRNADWRRITSVQIFERRRMKATLKEVTTKACLVGKIVKSWMKWAGHMVRIKYEIFPKRAETNTFKMAVLYCLER